MITYIYCKPKPVHRGRWYTLMNAIPVNSNDYSSSFGKAKVGIDRVLLDCQPRATCPLTELYDWFVTP